MPGDDIPGGPYRSDGRTWLVLFGDQAWHPVTVRAWREDHYGREVIDVEWHAAFSTWGESYIADPERMREA